MHVFRSIFALLSLFEEEQREYRFEWNTASNAQVVVFELALIPPTNASRWNNFIKPLLMVIPTTQFQTLISTNQYLPYAKRNFPWKFCITTSWKIDLFLGWWVVSECTSFIGITAASAFTSLAGPVHFLKMKCDTMCLNRLVLNQIHYVCCVFCCHVVNTML